MSRDFHNLEPQKYWSFPASFKGDKKQETINMIFSKNYVGARKYDGAFYKFIKNENGEVELLGRSKSVKGDYLNKIDNVPHLLSFFDKLPNGTCLLGEIVYFNNEGSNHTTEIMGCLPEKAILRQKNNRISYYVFDVLEYDGKDLVDSSIDEIIEYLNILKDFATEDIKIAEYFDGERLWEILQIILADGGEGMVITKRNTPYQPGKRPARQTLKIKKELEDTIDVVVMGANEPTRLYHGNDIESWKYWEDPTTGEKFNEPLYEKYEKGGLLEPITKAWYNDWAGSLNVGLYKDGKLTMIGSLSGLTEEVLSNWKDYLGKVAELNAMQITEDKALRHPRLVRFRDDKSPKECTWEQLI